MENYYVYENWTHDYCMLHEASCNFCNDGKGFHKNTSDKHGQWLGPFKDKKEAESAALKTKRERIADCYFCL